MTKVFISGSIGIKKLHKKVLERIHNIIESGFEIILGDADGVDTSIQAYLKEKKYSNVVIYHSGQDPRNNIGKWKTIQIETDLKAGTRSFFTVKDKALAKESDYGLMIWDGKSTGTLSNVIELLVQNKKSLVFIHKNKEFISVREPINLETLLGLMSVSALAKADKKIKLQEKVASLKVVQCKLF